MYTNIFTQKSNNGRFGAQVGSGFLASSILLAAVSYAALPHSKEQLLERGRETIASSELSEAKRNGQFTTNEPFIVDFSNHTQKQILQAGTESKNSEISHKMSGITTLTLIGLVALGVSIAATCKRQEQPHQTLDNTKDYA